MAEIVNAFPVSIPTGGGTYNVDIAQIYNPYVFTGTGTFTSNYTIAPSGTPGTPLKVDLLIFCTMDLDGNDFTVFGYKLNSAQVANGFVYASCTYDMTSWRVVVTSGTNSLPNDVPGVEYRTLGTGGGTIDLIPGVDKKVQYLAGTGTLTGSWVVQSTGGSPVDGNEFIVIYAATFDMDGNAITIFSNSLFNWEGLYGGIAVNAYYDEGNTTWQSSYSQAPNLVWTGVVDMVCIPISFEANALDFYHTMLFPINGVLSAIYTQVTSDMAGTNDGEIEVAIDSGSGPVVVTGSPITVTMSAAAGTQMTPFTPSSLNTWTNQAFLKLKATKTTTGGAVNCYVYWYRTPL